MPYVKLVGTTNVHTDWTSNIVLERDENGEVSKEVVAGVPTNLNSSDRKRLEERGYKFEDSSQEEAKEFAEQGGQAYGSDTSAAGPLFPSSEAPNQAVGDSGVDQQ